MTSHPDPTGARPDLASRPPPPPRVRGYGTVTRLFHWATALLVFMMLPVGIAMTSQGFEGMSDGLYIFHKGAGSVLLVVVAARILWKLFHRTPPLPPGVPAIQRRIAGTTHWILLFLLLTMTVSGYVRTVGDGFPIELLDRLGVPPLIGERPELARTMSVVHKFTAYLLVGVIAAHIGAAVHHAVIARDGVMRRIWPPVEPPGDREEKTPGHG